MPIETLQVAGIKRIYGVAGDSLNGITDSLRRTKTIEWVHMRHEEAGAFAAGAEAHLTGELAVCAGSCGPGNLHLINGLFDCYRSRVPVLAIAAHIPSEEIGSHYFQATHPESHFATMAEAMGIKAIRIEDLQMLEAAVREVLAHKGPALLDVVSARQELVMPPKATFDQAYHFGLFTLKAVMDGRATELIDLARTNLRL